MLFSDGDHHDSEDDDDCNGDNVEDNRISGLCDADAYENTLNGIAPVQTHFFPDLLVDRDSYWGNKDSSNQPLKHTKGLFSRLLLRDPLFANPNNVSLMTKGFGVYDRGSFLNIPPCVSVIFDCFFLVLSDMILSSSLLPFFCMFIYLCSLSCNLFLIPVSASFLYCSLIM